MAILLIKNVETYLQHMQNKLVVEIQSHDIISLIDPTLSDGHLCSCVDSFFVQMISNAILVLNVFCRYRYKWMKWSFAIKTGTIRRSIYYGLIIYLTHLNIIFVFYTQTNLTFDA
jgi:hypothetical protein